MIKEGTTKRDWLKLAGATAETALKSLTLGKDGFTGAISSLLRVFESVRGNDSTDRRAARLLLETLSYAIAKTVSSMQLARPPLKAELESTIEHLLARTQTLIEQGEVLFDFSHLENPGSFKLFDDISSRIFHELKPNDPKVREAQVVAIFQSALPEGLNRVRTRSPDYFQPVFDIPSGPAAQSDAKTRAWQKYRELLVRRFEDEHLFGQDGPGGVRLGQVFQNLRAWWDEESDDASVEKTRHVGMLDELTLAWLNKDDKFDRVRLISGGPGSPKVCQLIPLKR